MNLDDPDMAVVCDPDLSQPSPSRKGLSVETVLEKHGRSSEIVSLRRARALTQLIISLPAIKL
ncbi:hypothetical protein PAAG_11620 [Paracoccidioides lutzii Pb01]|uniref:Uncharacterized protein n=1 Tax=Paracoccidioides lutzii (strain ATCC MYA-826 / Pb01) TaxID=502779 RepID=A0A0A2V5N7_PARBA|nr:hypothetical protein PAAG_11620 [Paracoccidioides lutzii Pb01]KGQ01637.1 hypothetical protein PAAG_11620 [Paracoccidioides lutzii Pb01]